MKQALIAILRVTFFIMLFGSMAVYAQAAGNASCQLPDLRTDIRPDNDGEPTLVTVGLRIVDLTEISDVTQTLSGNFALSISWTDKRLVDLENCRIPLDKIWAPKIEFLNSGRLFADLPEVANIGPGGSIQYLQRYNGALATYHNLHDFPFDNQVFKLVLWPLENTEEGVQLKVNEKFTGYRKLLNISDWVIQKVTAETGRELSEISNEYYSTYHLLIHADRVTGYYIWKVIIPLSLIVAMSWAVFWINPAQFGPQIGLSATSMLTLIAFIFATTNLLPKLAYLTMLDKFIFTSTLLVFLALVESLSATYLFSKGHEKIGLLMDSICRWVFPMVFLSGVYLVFIVKL